MENLKAILATDADGNEVVTLQDINFNFQGGGIPQSMNGLNISINSIKVMKLANGQTVQVSDALHVRLLEKKQIADAMEEGENKTKANEEIKIWEKFLETMQTALVKALKSDYNLKNPIL